MKHRRRIAQILCLGLWLLASPALAAKSGVELLGKEEFLQLTEALSRKVNLFQDVWAKDPQAEFYGGTTRDFLYWVKKQFRDVANREGALALAEKLQRQSGRIDVRDFIIGESDVDLVSGERLELDGKKYGVKNIDAHGKEVFDPTTPAGKSELDQGFLPAEKIRLNSRGFISGHFGDGAGEIYSGKLTLHAPDMAKFGETLYAKQKLNHPVLLALRFLRLQAMNYFNTYGNDYPNTRALFDLDPAAEKFVRSAIASTLDGRELKAHMATERFPRLLNGVLQKMFRSYTNPTAAHLLAKEFGADLLPAKYDGIEPLNQFLFAQPRDPAAIEANLKKYGVSKDKFFLPVESRFTDGYLYHGTKTEEAFRGILLQGILPSNAGTAGGGLYGVPEKFKGFAENWGQDKNRLVRLRIDPATKLVDITQGEGKRIFRSFGGDEDAFAKAFGVDILRYEYGETEAYVVKNSSILHRPEGVHREILTLSKALKLAGEAKDPQRLATLVAGLSVGGLREDEIQAIAREAVSAGAFSKIDLDAPAAKFFPAISHLENKSAFNKALFRELITEHARRHFFPLRNFAEITAYRQVQAQHINFMFPYEEEERAAAEKWIKAGVLENQLALSKGQKFFQTLPELDALTTNQESPIRQAFLLERARRAAPSLRNFEELDEFLIYFKNITYYAPLENAYLAEIVGDWEKRRLLDFERLLAHGDQRPNPLFDLAVQRAAELEANKLKSAAEIVQFQATIAETRNPRVKLLFKENRGGFLTLLVEQWDKKKLLEPFTAAKDYTDFLQKMIFTKHSSLLDPLHRRLEEKLFDQAKSRLIPDLEVARKNFLEYWKLPAQQKSNAASTEVILPILLHTESPAHVRADLIRDLLRPENQNQQNKDSLILRAINFQSSQLKYDPPVLLAVLKDTQLEQKNPYLSAILKKEEIWRALLTDPATESEAYDLLVGKYWPTSMLTLSRTNLLDSPLPIPTLQKVLAKPYQEWMKPLQQIEGSDLFKMEATEDIYDFFLEKVLGHPEFSKQPGSVKLLEDLLAAVSEPTPRAVGIQDGPIVRALELLTPMKPQLASDVIDEIIVRTDADDLAKLLQKEP